MFLRQQMARSGNNHQVFGASESLIESPGIGRGEKLIFFTNENAYRSLLFFYGWFIGWIKKNRYP
jgi:hypothetical protein